MSKWEFTIKELKALQQETPDTPAIVEAYVEWVLLKDDQYSCGCIGYGYRGKCKHIDAVAKKQHSPKGA